MGEAAKQFDCQLTSLPYLSEDASVFTIRVSSIIAPAYLQVLPVVFIGRLAQSTRGGLVLGQLPHSLEVQFARAQHRNLFDFEEGVGGGNVQIR